MTPELIYGLVALASCFVMWGLAMLLLRMEKQHKIDLFFHEGD